MALLVSIPISPILLIQMSNCESLEIQPDLADPSVQYFNLIVNPL